MIRSRPAVLEALGDPRYRRLWLVGAAANGARWMDFLVLGWVALELTGSPLLVGVAAFCRSMPMLVLGPLAGALADRFDRGHVMTAVQLVNFAAAACLALLFATGHGGYGPMIALELAMGVAYAIDFPARGTVLYSLVGPARLTNAISLESVSMQGARMLGPLLGGVVLAHFGPAGCYAILTVLSAIAVALVRSLTRHTTLGTARAGAPQTTRLAAGLREAWARPSIRAVLVITVLLNALVFPYQHILSVFARDVFAIGPERLGLLVAAESLGALAGSLVIAGWRGFAAHALVFTGGSLGVTLLTIGFGFSPWFGLSLWLQLGIGIAEAGFGTMQSTIVLLSAPERIRGRVMGILSTCIGTQPFGALWIGFFAGMVGAPAATVAGAVLAAVVMVPFAYRTISRDSHSAAAA